MQVRRHFSLRVTRDQASGATRTSIIARQSVSAALLNVLDKVNTLFNNSTRNRKDAHSS